MKIASLFHLPRRLIMICLVAMTATPVLAADEQKPSFAKEREGGFVVPLQQSPPLRPVPIGYIREMVEGPSPASRLDVEPKDAGVAGAKMAIEENNAKFVPEPS